MSSTLNTSRPFALCHLLLCACVATWIYSGVSQAQAATMLWSSAMNVTDDNDVANTGTLKYAYRFAGSNGTAVVLNNVSFKTVAPVTVAGVQSISLDSGNLTFSNLDTTISAGRVSAAGLGTISNGDYMSLSTEYRTLLAAVAYSVTTAGDMSITLNNLTIGQEYRVQVWSDESRLPTSRRVSVYDGVLNLKNNIPHVEGGLGQYGIGTFVADSTSQSIILGRGNFINALSVFAVPEPTSLPVVGFAALAGWSFIRRRR